jgi:acyl-coenzyme A thioesterase PaaI-like protein
MLEETTGRCFACGTNNPIGLKLSFRLEGDEYVTEFTPGTHHQGYDDIVHGGLVATVLDEVMARMLWDRGFPFATAEMTVRYRAPLRVGTRARFVARMTRQRDKMIEAEAEALTEDGTVLASAKGRFLPVRGLEP